MLTDSDKAYIAGLIDSLAVLRTRRAGDADLPFLAINSTRMDAPLQWLAEQTGSKVTPRHRGYYKHNCTDHCPSAHQQITSVSASWVLTGARATIVLHNILPFLRLQHETARDLVQQGMALGYSGSVIKSMSAAGWDIPPLKEQPRSQFS